MFVRSILVFMITAEVRIYRIQIRLSTDESVNLGHKLIQKSALNGELEKGIEYKWLSGRWQKMIQCIVKKEKGCLSKERLARCKELRRKDWRYCTVHDMRREFCAQCVWEGWWSCMSVRHVCSETAGYFLYPGSSIRPCVFAQLVNQHECDYP